MFFKKQKQDIVPVDNHDEDDGRPRYLTERPRALKVTKKNNNEVALPKDLQNLSAEEIKYIMAKIKSGDFKRYDRNAKGHSLLHIFSGLGISKLAKALVEMVQGDPRVLNALDNNGNSALDYATVAKIKNLIQAYGGKKSLEILEQYSREAVAWDKSMGGQPKKENPHQRDN